MGDISKGPSQPRTGFSGEIAQLRFELAKASKLIAIRSIDGATCNDLQRNRETH
jgi:hypothetical protein